MLIGLTPRTPPATDPATPDVTPPDIIDVTTASFETAVLRESMRRPVLVDFWAPWCGPCRQLTPVLEKAVAAAKGKVLLAKINIDANPELAQAFRVQSVPFVVALFQGQPVTAFAGAQPPQQIQSLIDQLITLGGGSAAARRDIPALLEQAAQALAQNDPLGAQAFYVSILEEDANNGPAYAGLIRSAIAQGKIDQAEGLITGAPEGVRAHPDVRSAENALAIARTAPADDPARLAAALVQDPGNQTVRIDLALALFARGARDAAITHLIESIAQDRTFDDSRARTQLLALFDAMGPDDPLTLAGRRKLSSVLFS